MVIRQTQLDSLRLFHKFWAHAGRAPSQAEMAKRLRITLNAAALRMRKLERKGLLGRYGEDTRRSLCLTRAGLDAVGQRWAAEQLLMGWFARGGDVDAVLRAAAVVRSRMMRAKTGRR